MVIGMFPATTLQAEAAEDQGITITAKDSEGNPISGAEVQATVTESVVDNCGSGGNDSLKTDELRIVV